MEVHAGKWIMMCLAALLSGDLKKVNKVTHVSFKTEKERKEVIRYARKVGIMLPASWGLDEEPISRKEVLTMAKGKKKTANKKVKEKVKKNSATEAKKPEADELSSLKKAVEQAKQHLENAQAEANELQRKAQELVAEAKNSYREALVPYREACKKAGVECEFSAGRLSNVSERVTFLVEKVDDGIKVTIKGRPETEEVIPAETLNQSINKAAYGYTEKHLGPKEEIGNKGGTLSNLLRALWK